ncbi:MAG TPA: AAA family ATPase, partial [Solirubrobacteraceae bacterium]|nr:AAA family ATPase [Solirubrobacteraceae bacterium]
MGTATGLVGREAERARLAQALERAGEGAGSLVLVSGEAGIGKSRLAEEVAANATARVLRGAGSHSAPTPYGPVVAALRSHLRAEPDGLADCGPLRPHLALLLPELGEAAAATDRPTLVEAIRCALAHVAADGPALVVLDDLQWSDQATLELLAALARPLREMPLLVLAAYRSDGLPRDHMLRWLRTELRRAGVLEEVTLEALDRSLTEALLTQLLPEAPSPALVRVVHDRAQGSPFFVEELARALVAGGGLRPGRRGLELGEDGRVPLPDTVRDAVTLRASGLSDAGRDAVEVAAVAGEAFDLALVEALAGEAGVVELVERGLVAEGTGGRAGFRHSLTREALYAEVPWTRRRALHRRLAEALEAAGGRSMEIATHWMGAADPNRGRAALLRAAAESEAVHAYRDAARAGRQALELWPAGEADELRVQALERYARCAELAGELPEAAKTWRELAAIRSSAGERAAFAEAHRRLAAVSELRGEREPGFASRRLAADAFAEVGRRADAAAERLAMANHRRSGARYAEAIELAETAVDDARAADRIDLTARGLGVLGVVRAKGGEFDAGLETIRGGLALALEHDLTPVAAELYQRLSLALYDSADYRRAKDALDTALGLCEATGDEGTEVACVTCLIYVLRERGEWSRAAELGRELIDDGTAVWVAEGLLGVMQALQGKFSSARRMLTASRAVSARVGHYNMFVDATTGLAYVAAGEGATDEAAEHCRTLLTRWEDSEDHHYAVWGLRWAAAFFAGGGMRAEAQACAEALARMAADAGHPYALAALAQAIAETALLEGDASTAAEQLCRAVELHRGLDVPFERAQIELRAGVALAAAGERDAALENLGAAYRTARKLGARPLATRAATEVAALGESVAPRLGDRA